MKSNWNTRGACLLFILLAHQAFADQSILLLMGNASNVVATPIDSNSGGSCSGSSGSWTCSGTTTVTLSDSTSGATILYTTSGTAPVCPSTGTTYSTGFSVSTTTTVKAIGCKSGMTDSAVLTSVYTISGGGITITANTLGTAGDGSISQNDSGADGLYIWGGGLFSGITVSDTCGSNHNVWVPDTSFSNGTNNLVLWHADNSTGSLFTCSGHSYSLSGGGAFSWGVIAATGMKTSGSLDDCSLVCPVGGSNSGTTVQTSAAANPGSGKHLIIVVVSAGATAGSWSGVDSGFTLQNQRDFLTGTNYEGGAFTLIQSSGASIQPIGTFGASGTLGIGLFSFGGV